MTGIKRITGWLSVLALLLSLCSAVVLPASAAKTLDQLLYDGLMAVSSDVDISSAKASDEELNKAFQRLVFEKPELFFVGMDYQFQRDRTEGHVTAFYPTYTMWGGTLASARREYQWMVNNIASKVDSSWSDLEKVVFLHDYFAQRFEYDDSLSIYDAYTFLKNGIGVCQAYTLAFRAVTDKLGINTSWAYSDDMGHIWTTVEIDGAWYHLDVTWDDTRPNLQGRAKHTFFLLSDAALSQAGHYNWVSDHACTSTRFDTNAPWADLANPLAYAQGTWYCFVNGDLYACDLASGTRRLVRELSLRWSAGEGKNWNGTFTGLSAYDGKLYFNTPDTLCCYDPATDTLTEMVRVGVGENALYGSYLQNDLGSNKVVMHYEIASSPNSGDHVAYGEYEFHEHVWGDGEVTTPATCTAEGERVYTCGKCGATYTEAIEQLAHTHSATWTNDADSHWHECACGDKADKAAHTFEWVIDTPATEEATGLMHEECTSCGYTRSEDTVIPVLGAAILGDVDGNEKINTTDARLTLQYAAGRIDATKLNVSAADVDGNSKINTTDARLILQKAANRIPAFPAEK